MIFKRKKKAVRELSKNQIVEEQFIAMIQSAETIKDPAEKISRLQVVRSCIMSQLHNESSEISKKADKSEDRINTGGNMAFWGGLITAGVVSGPLVWAALGVGAAGYVGGEIIGSVRAKSVKKKLEKKALSHTEKMQGLYALTGQMISTAVEQQRAETVSNLKALADKFSTATEKPAVETDKVPAIEVQPVPPAAEVEAVPPVVEVPAAPPAAEVEAAPPVVEVQVAPPAAEVEAVPPAAEDQPAPPAEDKKEDVKLVKKRPLSGLTTWRPKQ